jgi:hypothetical protein
MPDRRPGRGGGQGVETGGDLLENYIVTKVGDVSQYRGGVVLLRDKMNDPVSTGPSRPLQIDAYDRLHPVGKDEGRERGWVVEACTGGTWSGRGHRVVLLAHRQRSLRRLHVLQADEQGGVGELLDIVGVVYPGEPPGSVTRSA